MYLLNRQESGASSSFASFTAERALGQSLTYIVFMSEVILCEWKYGGRVRIGEWAVANAPGAIVISLCDCADLRSNDCVDPVVDEYVLSYDVARDALVQFDQAPDEL